ncbi:hypothetical protein ACFL10_01985 [Patescibacteria group bacterium]
MNVNLSWDLFIIVFFGLIVAYSLIIGRNNNIKVILATYVAALFADAVGNLFGKTLALSDNFMKLMKLFYIDSPEDATVLVKILMLIVIIVLLSVRGSYNVDVNKAGPPGVKVGINMLFGFLNACLIVSIALIFVSGSSFIVGDPIVTSSAFQDIYSQSNIARILIDQYSVWFMLPALAFIGISFFSEKTEN